MEDLAGLGLAITSKPQKMLSVPAASTITGHHLRSVCE